MIASWPFGALRPFSFDLVEADPQIYSTAAGVLRSAWDRRKAWDSQNQRCIMKTLFPVIATLILTCVPAYAGWQGTEWGMNPKQAQAAYKAPLSSVPVEEQTKNVPRPLLAKLSGVYSAGDIKFKLLLAFDANDKLALARLQAINEEQCADLPGLFIKRYGNPTSGSPISGLISYSWSDASSKNKVQLLYFIQIKSCVVDYLPFDPETIKKL